MNSPKDIQTKPARDNKNNKHRIYQNNKRKTDEAYRLKQNEAGWKSLQRSLDYDRDIDFFGINSEGMTTAQGGIPPTDEDISSELNLMGYNNF